jgi:hypothetical protein
MMNFLRDWVNEDNQWVVLALLFGLGVLVLVALVHSTRSIRHLGFLNFLRSTCRIEGETWRIIGILLLLAMACAMMSSQWI